MKSCNMLFGFLLVVSLVFIPACRGPKVKGLVPVQGKVTYCDEPLEGATVSFTPKDFKTGDRIGVGRTDAQGKFELRTIGEPGVLPNDYRVFIVKNSVVSTSPAKSAPEKTGNRQSPGPPKLGKGEKIQSQIPKRYNNAGTSGLEFTIGKNGLKDVRIELID